MEELVLQVLIKFPDGKINYDKKLYEDLRHQGKIKQATGLERERIIKQANGDIVECKRIQLEEYFRNKLKEQI